MYHTLDKRRGLGSHRKGTRMAYKALTSYRDKMQQANREAKATVVALVVIVAVWFVGGIGLAGSGIELFHTPIWIIGGCVGTWLASVVAAVVLVKRVFADFDLDDSEGEGDRG